MSPSGLVNATQAWTRHLRACQDCLAVARAFGEGTRCDEGEALREAMCALQPDRS